VHSLPAGGSAPLPLERRPPPAGGVPAGGEKYTSMNLMAVRGRFSRGLRPLWRMRPLTGLILSLPVLFIGVWYGWRALAAHEALRETSGEAVPLTLETFQLHLHDRLKGDLRRLRLPNPPKPAALPVVSLTLARSDFQALTTGLSGDTNRPYVPCFVSKGGAPLRAKVRVRGGQPWHWAHPQKSLKIVIEKEPGQGPEDEPYLDGEKTLNLINECTPLGVGEDVILDILRDLGVMTPDHGLARVVINRRPVGVYFLTGQANEDLLRKNGRAYGSLYSGDKAPPDPKTGLSTLWREPKAWKKVASWKPDEDKDLREITRLLRMVNEAPPAEFVRFARDEIDLEKFAAYDAVDVVFGGNQHDWDQDHKLFFDPYRGKWEPIAENFRGWANQPVLQSAENPLRLRLAEVPGYLARRNRIVHELLTGPCAVHEIRARLRKQVRDAEAEYAADPYWDAYHLLPPASRALRRLVRPMDEARQAAALEEEVHDFAQRHAFLLRRLEAGGVDVRLSRTGEGREVLEVRVEGDSAFRLEAVVTAGEAAEPGRPTRLFRDADRDGSFDPAKDPLEAEAAAGPDRELRPAGVLLEPGVRMVARPPGRPNLGPVAIETAPRLYRFFVENAPVFSASGARRNIPAVEFTDAVTGRRVRAAPAGAGAASPGADAGEPPDAAPRFEAGRIGPHPWSFPPPEASETQLGPGEIVVEGTRVFEEGRPVRIEPGTRFRLGPGASLVFRSRVEAAGTAQRPIDVVRAIWTTPFGGIALQGPGTAGSALRHVRVRGGSAPAWQFVRYPATVCLHDTRDVTLDACTVAESPAPFDLFHAAYVNGLAIEDCRFLRAGADALDLEFTEARIAGTWVVRAGPTDEALDLQASKVEARECVFACAGGNAVSVGERSEARLYDCLLAESGTGALVKSRSELVLEGALLYRLPYGVRLHSRSPKYGGRSHASADVLAAVECALPVWVDDGSATDIRHVETRIPGDGPPDWLPKRIQITDLATLHLYVPWIFEKEAEAEGALPD
jgi:hypothetical protein